jgi:hypothetical protein
MNKLSASILLALVSIQLIVVTLAFAGPDDAVPPDPKHSVVTATGF